MGSEINALSQIYSFLLQKNQLSIYIQTTKLRLSICTSLLEDLQGIVSALSHFLHLQKHMLTITLMS